MAVVVRVGQLAENTYLPEAVLGAVVTVVSSTSHYTGALVWKLKESLAIVSDVTIHALLGGGGRSTIIRPGERYHLMCLPDCCLQPIRGVKAGTTTKTREPIPA